MGIMGTPTGFRIRASAVPLLNLVNLVRNQLGRPVIDKTNLKGLFDFSLQFRSEETAAPSPTGAPGSATPPAADPAPSLLTAIQELGLRLDSSTGPVEVLVVDSAQKPAEN